MTETWGHSDFAFVISGYNAFQKDRPNRHGGGVCILMLYRLTASMVIAFFYVTYMSDFFGNCLWFIEFITILISSCCAEKVRTGLAVIYYIISPLYIPRCLM